MAATGRRFRYESHTANIMIATSPTRRPIDEVTCTTWLVAVVELLGCTAVGMIKFKVRKLNGQRNEEDLRVNDVIQESQILFGSYADMSQNRGLVL